jgi:hypothetical protein
VGLLGILTVAGCGSVGSKASGKDAGTGSDGAALDVGSGQGGGGGNAGNNGGGGSAGGAAGTTDAAVEGPPGPATWDSVNATWDNATWN